MVHKCWTIRVWDTGLDSSTLPTDPVSFLSLLESCWAAVCTLAGSDANSGWATLKLTPIVVWLRAGAPQQIVPSPTSLAARLPVPARRPLLPLLVSLDCYIMFGSGR